MTHSAEEEKLRSAIVIAADDLLESYKDTPVIALPPAVCNLLTHVLHLRLLKSQQSKAAASL